MQRFKKFSVLVSTIAAAMLAAGCAGTAPMPSEKYQAEAFVNVGSISPFRSGYGLIAYPAVSPDGASLVSTSGTGDIYLSRMDGSNEKLIYNKAADENLKKVYDEEVDLRDNPYAQEAAVMMKASGFLMKWAEGVREVTSMVWSPDGSRIAVNVSNGMANISMIYVIDVNTAKRTAVRFYRNTQHNGRLHNGVSWVDDHTLAYSYFDAGRLVFVTHDLTTKGVKVVAEDEIVRGWYSPDGKQIVYYSPTDESFDRFDLWIANSDLNGAKKLAERQKYTNKRISWSADSSRLYYVDEAGVIHNILYEYRPADGTKSVVTEADLLTSPYMNAKGQLYLNVNNNIFRVNVK